MHFEKSWNNLPGKPVVSKQPASKSTLQHQRWDFSLLITNAHWIGCTICYQPFYWQVCERYAPHEPAFPQGLNVCIFPVDGWV